MLKQRNLWWKTLLHQAHLLRPGCLGMCERLEVTCNFEALSEEATERHHAAVSQRL